MLYQPKKFNKPPDCLSSAFFLSYLYWALYSRALGKIELTVEFADKTNPPFRTNSYRPSVSVDDCMPLASKYYSSPQPFRKGPIKKHFILLLRLKTLLFGILFQLMVFILIFGTGVSCWGSFSVCTSTSMTEETGLMDFCIAGGGGIGAGGGALNPGGTHGGGGGGGGCIGPERTLLKF